MLPNTLTIIRIIAIPFFVYYLLTDNPLVALAIFVTACISDYYDGMLARKYQNVTKFGQLMDPLADKLLVLSALVLLCIKPINYIHWIVTSIIALREVVITFLRSHYLKKKITIPANIWGKIKTVLQMIGIISALTFYTAFQLNVLPASYENITILLIQIFFSVVVIVTILSGYSYFKRDKS